MFVISLFIFLTISFILFYVSVKPKQKESDVDFKRERNLQENIVTNVVPKEEKTVLKKSKEFVWHRTVKVRGISYRDDGMKLLVNHNQSLGREPFNGLDKKEIREFVREYETNLYEYPRFKTTDVKLEPEPDNPVDKNAIKVIVKGNFIGYISKGYAKQLQKYVNQPQYVVYGTAEVYGGNYKFWDWEKRKVEDGKSNISCKIDLKVKKVF